MRTRNLIALVLTVFLIVVFQGWADDVSTLSYRDGAGSGYALPLLDTDKTYYDDFQYDTNGNVKPWPWGGEVVQRDYTQVTYLIPGVSSSATTTAFYVGDTDQFAVQTWWYSLDKVGSPDEEIRYIGDASATIEVLSTAFDPAGTIGSTTRNIFNVPWVPIAPKNRWLTQSTTTSKTAIGSATQTLQTSYDEFYTADINGQTSLASVVKLSTAGLYIFDTGGVPYISVRYTSNSATQGLAISKTKKY